MIDPTFYQFAFDAFAKASTPAQVLYVIAVFVIMGVLASYTEPHVRIGGSKGISDGEHKNQAEAMDEYRVWLQNIEDVQLDRTFRLEIEVLGRLDDTGRSQLTAFLFHGPDAAPTPFSWNGATLEVDVEDGLPALAAWLLVIKVPKTARGIRIRYQRPLLVSLTQWGGMFDVQDSIEHRTFGRPLRADRATMLSVALATLAFPLAMEAFSGDPYAGVLAGGITSGLVLLFGAIAYALCRRVPMPIVQGFVGWDLKESESSSRPRTGALTASASPGDAASATTPDRTH